MKYSHICETHLGHAYVTDFDTHEYILKVEKAKSNPECFRNKVDNRRTSDRKTNERLNKRDTF